MRRPDPEVYGTVHLPWPMRLSWLGIPCAAGSMREVAHRRAREEMLTMRKDTLTAEGVAVLTIGLVAAAAFAIAAFWIATGSLDELAHTASHLPMDAETSAIVYGELGETEATLYRRLTTLAFASFVVWGGLAGYAAKRLSVLRKGAD